MSEQQINTLKEFLNARGFGEKTFADVERNTYKYTNCGAWIQEETEGTVDYESPHIEEFNDAPTYEHPIGLTVGSIGEGSDCNCESITLCYPFRMEQFWEALKSIEAEADVLWHQANTEEVAK